MVNWELLLSTFVGSGASFTLISLLFEHRKHKQQRSEAAGLLALQIAFQLEAYAITCANAESDQEVASETDGHAGRYITEVPKVPTFPESDAYKLLNAGLLHEVLEFRQRRDLAQQAADFWGDVVGEGDCYRNAAAQNSLIMGAHALDIAKRLREAHHQPARDLTFGPNYNLETHLAEKARRALEAKGRAKAIGPRDAGRTPHMGNSTEAN